MIIPNMGISTDVLFTKTQQRVLSLLFTHPSRSFYANEMIGLAASGSGAVQRELTRLEAAGLITTHRIGNQKHYQANATSPIFSELRSIVIKTFGITDVLLKALDALSVNIELAFIYGSVAKNNEHAASDIDLMVIGDISSNAALLDALSPASIELGRPINPTLYTHKEFVQRVRDGKVFIARVLAQPKLFLYGSDDVITQISTGKSVADRKTQSRVA